MSPCTVQRTLKIHTQHNSIHSRPLIRFIPPLVDRSTLDDNVAFVQNDTLVVVQFEDDRSFRDDSVVDGDSTMTGLLKMKPRSVTFIVTEQKQKERKKNKLLPRWILERNRLSGTWTHLY